MRVLRHLVSASVMALASAVALACGSSDTDADPSGPQVSTFGNSDCGKCVDERCAVQIETCTSDPGCTSYLSCLRDCPVDANGIVDATCDAECSPPASSETSRTQAELMSCRLYGDAATCEHCGIPAIPFQDGTPQQCQPRPETPPTPCRKCYWEKCCDTWDACYLEGVNPDCDALGTCISQCVTGSPACVQACYDAHPGSLNTLFAQNACATEFCAWDTDNCDPAERDECESCLYDTCSPSWVGLMSKPEGFLLFLCMGGCEGSANGPQCVEDCFTQYPGAEAAGYLWGECVAANCDSIC